jgi:hypothetical protein
MAAATVSTIVRHSAGSNTLVRVSFSNIDDTNTWDSGIYDAVGYWANGTDTPGTQTKSGIDVAYTARTGRFTFSCGEDARTGDLIVLFKG